MIQLFSAGLVTSIGAFITANYASATDGLDAVAVYIDPEFEDDKSETYNRLLAKQNFSAVIWNEAVENDPLRPLGHQKFRYSCNLSFVRKSANQWDASNRRNRVLRGTTAAPLMNSLHALVANYSAYLRENRLLNGSDYVSFSQEIVNMNAPIIVGDFATVTCEVRALSIQSTTISVTPV